MKVILSFNFKDGASFTVENKIIINTSPLGRPFYQFPCTFHNATLPNGEKIKNISEVAVKKAFNLYYNKNGI